MSVDLNQKKKLRSVDLMIGAKAALLFGVLVLGSSFYFRLMLLFSISFLCLTLVAPLLAILSCATSLDLQDAKARRSSIVLIYVLSVPLFAGIVHVIAFSLPYLYTPPAITSENCKFYRSCVEFVKSRNEYKDISVSWKGHYVKDGAYFPTIDSNSVDVNKNFSGGELSEMLLLSKEMKKFGCIRFRRNMDIILFYKHRNRILPSRPGVVFSINGISPNDVDNEIVNEHKPFLRIDDGWYMSRQLVYGGIRADIRMSLPKSLIDHSLRTEGLKQE